MLKNSVSKRPQKRIFIIYQSHEEEVARSLKGLLEFWDYSADFCRQVERDIDTYKKELRQKLTKADLVLIILSKELQWSPYSHAEIGAAVLLKKSIIVILIPPLKPEKFNEIAPVLEGYWIQDASEVNFFQNLKTQIGRKLKIKHFDLNISNLEQQKYHYNRVSNEMSKASLDYALTPARTLHRIWAPPALNPMEPAPKSIVENIKRSLANGKSETRLVFVGVSLKYSFRCITNALTSFVKEVETCLRNKPTNKTLHIELIHMDDQAHILHALHDYEHDIPCIRENFHEKWEAKLAEWRVYCKQTSILLTEPIICPIDYIPPRVGILIDGEGDDCFLYAGRCAFNEPGKGFRLFVGELEYSYFTGGSKEGLDAIEEFKCCLKIYGSKKYNSGIVQAAGTTEWLERLCDYIKYYPNIEHITVISASATRCADLIVAAIQKGIRVNIYVHHPKKASSEVRADIENIADRLTKKLRKANFSKDADAYIFYYKHPSPFRAILIGNAALGVQMYLHPMKATEAINLTKGGPLPLIIPASSSRFGELKEKIVDDFLNTTGVDVEHEFIIRQGKIVKS